VRIDLHTHSRASDGTQAPEELVRAAAEAGLDVVALTDHDTADGWDEAAEAAVAAGVSLVRGMEISTRHSGGRGVHLLAYLPDPTYPPLVAELARILDGRDARVPVMIQKLQECGIQIDDDDVRRVAGATTATGRPHVADALVALGAVRDRDDAFAKYLSAGRPAYVDRYATPLDEMVEIVAGAGGVSVVAHPWGRHQRATLDESALAELADRGLTGIEVDHQDHDEGERRDLRAIARNLGLVATGSSDHHGTGKVGHELGCNTTEPDEFARLLDLARASAVRSGRPAPTLVNGR
jgi:predicted metal-dependent phosphoesterase TrpH